MTLRGMLEAKEAKEAEEQRAKAISLAKKHKIGKAQLQATWLVCTSNPAHCQCDKPGGVCPALYYHKCCTCGDIKVSTCRKKICLQAAKETAARDGAKTPTPSASDSDPEESEED
jgi:hypothetical protein